MTLAFASIPLKEKSRAPGNTICGTTMSRMPTLFAEFIFNGVYERFPGLKVVGGEVGAGWVPFLKQELDDRYRRNRYWCEVNLSMLPSEYYDRNLTSFSSMHVIRCGRCLCALCSE